MCFGLLWTISGHFYSLLSGILTSYIIHVRIVAMIHFSSWSVRCSHSGVSSIIQSQSGLLSRASLRLNIAGKQQSFFRCFHVMNIQSMSSGAELFKHMLNNLIVFLLLINFSRP